MADDRLERRPQGPQQDSEGSEDDAYQVDSGILAPDVYEKGGKDFGGACLWDFNRDPPFPCWGAFTWGYPVVSSFRNRR
jgi:hypothetical protein